MGREEECHLEEGDKRGYHTSAQLEQLAVELYKRLEKIGYETPYEKRQQHSLEDVDKPYDTDEQHTVYDKTHGAVKVIRLSMWHDCVGLG